MFLSAALVARADDFWKHKPASQWTLEQALKLVRNSPWAHEEVLPVYVLQQEAAFSRLTGTKHCDPDAIDVNGNCMQKRVEMPVDPSRQLQALPEMTPSWAVLVRWDSAAPVRMAFARLAELDAKAAAAYQGAPSRLPADQYVVTVKLVQASRPIVDPFASKREGKAAWQATLKTRRGIIAAVETEYSGAGAGAAIHFFFPRTLDGAPLLGAAREQVEFILRGERFAIKSKFSLDPELAN